MVQASENEPLLPASSAGVLASPTLIDEALARWLGDARVSDAAEGRRRRRNLADQAAESATVLGVLVDLAETKTDVQIGLTGGDTVAGAVTGVGIDFVAVRTPSSLTLVRASAVATVRAGPATAGVTGDRTAPLATAMNHLFGPIAADRPPVTVQFTDGAKVSGTLVSAGSDVLRIQPEGQASPVWVATVAVAVLRLH